jgi:hypothetical protein
MALNNFDWKRSSLPALFGALAFFIILWGLDFPKPMVDDLFYNGAALHMADGGDFSNPFLLRQGFPNHFFYVYPPLQSYAVYWWVSVWGVTAASLLAFQNLMYFFVAAAMIVLLHRQAAPAYLLWLVPFGVAAVFLPTGLRPEPLAVALTMGGFCLLGSCQTAGFKLWLSFLLMFLGASAAPRTAFFAVALVIAGWWQWMKFAPEKRFRLGGLVISAAFAAGIVFLVLIHFRLAQFLETFHVHAARVQSGRWLLFQKFVEGMGKRWLPLFALTVVALFWQARRASKQVSGWCYGLAAAFVIAALLGSLGHGSSWYLIVILLALTAALNESLGRLSAVGINVAVAVALLFANAGYLVEIFGLLTGKIHEASPENRQQILALVSTNQDGLLVDSHTARYVFDFRVPARAVDFQFAAPFPGFMAFDVKLRPEDTFVLGPQTLLALDQRLHTHFEPETWGRIDGRWWQWKYPRKATIVSARGLIEMTGEIPGQQK